MLFELVDDERPVLPEGAGTVALPPGCVLYVEAPRSMVPALLGSVLRVAADGSVVIGSALPGTGVVPGVVERRVPVESVAVVLERAVPSGFVSAGLRVPVLVPPIVEGGEPGEADMEPLPVTVDPGPPGEVDMVPLPPLVPPAAAPPELPVAPPAVVPPAAAPLSVWA